MTNEEINKTIHEAMGLCIHTYGAYITGECKCTARPCKIPDYTSDWSAFGRAIEWLVRQEWLAWFLNTGNGVYYRRGGYAPDVVEIKVDLLDPLKGSTAIANFIVVYSSRTE